MSYVRRGRHRPRSAVVNLPKAAPHVLLAHALLAFRSDLRIRGTELLDRLRRSHPDRYGDWQVGDLLRQMRAGGVLPVQVYIHEGPVPGRTALGYLRPRVVRALALPLPEKDDQP
jgi:hypothetical protein